MNPWEFNNPVRIRFGCGVRRQLSDVLSEKGSVLVVTSPGNRCRPAVVEILETLRDRQLIVIDDVLANPTLADLEAKFDSLAGTAISDVVAIGGGSVLDSAKVLAVGLTQMGWSLRDHLVNGAPLPDRRSNTLICLPTTAGTGSEVTPFATVWDDARKKKYSVAGPLVFADQAVLDPELTLSMPREVTVMTGLDAITQAFEATWSRRANGVSSAAAIRAIRLGLSALPALLDDLQDIELRAAMLEASLLAGLAISVSRTALCHAISYPLTLHLKVPHGLACGFVLPEVLAFNKSFDLSRFDALALSVGLADASALHAAVGELMDNVGVGDMLRGQGFSREQALALAPEMLAPGRADNNLRAASVDDVASILATALDGRRF